MDVLQIVPDRNKEVTMVLKCAVIRAAVIVVAIQTSASAFAKTVLPDACGDNKVEFDVNARNNQPPPAGPDAGKALIVFVGTTPGGPVSQVRFGLDGGWAGATKGKSYFAVSVAPGEHHLCAAFHQGFLLGKSFNSAVPVDINAEADKVYYYEAVALITPATPPPTIVGARAPGQPPPTVVGGGTSGSASFSFVPLSDAEGKYRVKAWELSASTPKRRL